MTTDMQARDEAEFEAWLKTVDILRVPMNGKAAYMAALAAERARSAVLVDALELIAAADGHFVACDHAGEIEGYAKEVLKTYRQNEAGDEG